MNVSILPTGLLLLLAACNAGVFEQPYKQGPQISTVILTVQWMTADEVRKQCSDPAAYACATVGTVGLPISTIYAIKPRSFTQAPLVEALGHELLHSLGATH